MDIYVTPLPIIFIHPFSKPILKRNDLQLTEAMDLHFATSTGDEIVALMMLGAAGHAYGLT